MTSVTTFTMPSTSSENGDAMVSLRFLISPMVDVNALQLLHLDFNATVSENTRRLIIKYLQEHDGKVAPHFRKLVEVRNAHVEEGKSDNEGTNCRQSWQVELTVQAEAGAYDAVNYTEKVPSNGAGAFNKAASTHDEFCGKLASPPSTNDDALVPKVDIHLDVSTEGVIADSVNLTENPTSQNETTADTYSKPANTSERESTTHHFNHVDDTLYAKLEKLDSWADVEKEMEGAGLEMPAALKPGANTLYASRWARKA